MHCKQLNLRDIWRTCNKIRAAIFRMGINLSEYFKPLDRNNSCLVSESQFISVIHGQLGATIGLSEQEVIELANYFQVPDGRIYYSQMCNVINDSVPHFHENPSFVSGLEWEDPMHFNRLSITEEKRSNILEANIAAIVGMKKLALRPYFQDYELVAKNNGVVTITHFARILTYFGILLSEEDFKILVKKYIKDSYTINHTAFLAAIIKHTKYLEANGLLDINKDVMAIAPGRVVNAELPKLPRPEIGKILASKLFGQINIFHPAFEETKPPGTISTIMPMIQEHVLRNRLRVHTFFKHFDPLNCGRISLNQFHRGLDALALNGKQRFFLTPLDVDIVTNQYRDPCDPTKVCWKTFEDDVDHIFTIKELEKTPSLKMEIPEESPQRHALNQSNLHKVNRRTLCVDAVYKVKQKIIHRRILLKPMFRDFDKHNNGHVSRNQMRQALNSSGILLSDAELFALEDRFNDDVGFNYVWFIKEVQPMPTNEPLFVDFLESMRSLNADHQKRPPTRQEKDIVRILAKIKDKVVAERIRVLDFFRDFDRCNENVISQINFHRALLTCGFDLTCNEIQTLTEVFSSPLRTKCVDYRRFTGVLEEAFTQPCLERAPLIIPMQHVPTKDSERNFLNFDERQVLKVAMVKLSKMPDLKMNLSSVLKDFDKTNCGTVSKIQFLKALTLRGMYNQISNHEFDVICKGFAFEKGMRDEVDYRAFMIALDILYDTEKYNPF